MRKMIEQPKVIAKAIVAHDAFSTAGVTALVLIALYTVLTASF